MVLEQPHTYCPGWGPMEEDNSLSIRTMPGGGEQDDPPALIEESAASTGTLCVMLGSVGLSGCSGTGGGAEAGSKEGRREEGGEALPYGRLSVERRRPPMGDLQQKG